MKIIHTSDVHIDSPLTARLPAGKVRERRAELSAGFKRLIGEAERLGVDAVIIAGDLFDTDRISKHALTSAIDVIGASSGITFYYLEGNHEKNAIRESGIPLPNNLKIFEENWTYFEADNTNIVGRCSIAKGMFESLEMSAEATNIVVLHGELRDKTDDEEAIGLQDTKNKNIDYLALGHYHSYSATELPDGGVAVYSGTPEGRGFDETGEKGFVLINIENGKVSHTFIPFAKRKLRIIPLDITDATRTSDIYDMAKNALREISRDDLIRLELCGGYSPELIKDIEGITEKFSDVFYYFEVKDSSRPQITPDDYKFDKTLKGEFIRTVLSDETLDEEMKGRIISCGINALMGEELFEE